MKPACMLLTLIGMLFLVGCSTIKSRIQDNAALFNSLDKTTQTKIEFGIIEKGFTEQMVFIALGEPDYKAEVVTASAKETVWTYVDVTGGGDPRIGEDHNPSIPNATHTEAHVITEHRETEHQNLWSRRKVIFRNGTVISVLSE